MAWFGVRDGGKKKVVHSWRLRGFEASPLGLPSFAAVDLETD